MKKLVTIILALSLVGLIAGCNNASDLETTQNSTTQTDTEDDHTNTTDGASDANSTTDQSTNTTVSDDNTSGEDSSTTIETGVAETVHTHNFEKKSNAPTCTAEGYTTYTCACGESYVSDKVVSVGHKFGEWKTTKEPTAAATGLAERKCANCNTAETKTLSKVISNHTHSYTSKATKNATCTQEGVKTFTCSCGESYTEAIAKTSHSYKTTTTTATCTNDGYTTHKCSTCSDTYVDNRTNALGHAYQAEIAKPTCTVSGYTKHTCSRCGTSYKDTTTNATGHAYAFTSDTATCTANGVRTETCSKCGNKKTSTSNALGHTLKTETVNATCRVDGYTKETCTACGTVVSNTTITATGQHNYTAQVVADVANEYVSKNDLTFAKYINYTDWLVDRCSDCGYCVLSKMYFRYTDYEAAVIMLGYVNDLRAEVYGTHDYDLVLDETLIEWSKTRAKAITKDFSHNGKPFSCGENIVGGGESIYAQFKSWKNSSGHYNNMINKDYKYFGYAFYNATQGTAYANMYGVQLFKYDG